MADQAGDDLAAMSVRSMLAHQVPSGAFLASADFAPYWYCWLRDGSFTAFALDRAGEHEAAEKFHRWAGAAISGIASTVRAATEHPGSSVPPARYTLEGTVEVADDWPNFQVDGYGTWLWSLSEHVGHGGAGPLVDELAEPIELTANYLVAAGLGACYDCWEENGQAVHTSTLACVYGGLCAASRLLGQPSLASKAGEVGEHISSRLRKGDRFAKSSADRGVDASLLWLAVPFGVVSPVDPAMAATAAEITTGLDLDGGVRRYPADTYYGGGAWPLLTAWLGWYRTSTGDLAAAQRCASWVESCFDGLGHLPEQVGGRRRDPASYDKWVGQWGPPAADLAWSHAMYIVLRDELRRATDPPLAANSTRRQGVTPIPPGQPSQGTSEQERG